MSISVETKFLHNPLKDDITLYFGEKNGIMVEHMRRPADFSMKYNHFHQEYEIYLLLDGRRQFFIDNRSYLMQRGDLLILDSNQLHMSHGVEEDPSDFYERIILYIPKGIVREYDRMYPELQMEEFLHRQSGVYNLSLDQIKHLQDTLGHLEKEIDENQSNDRIMLDLEIISFFIYFWRENTPSGFLKDRKSGNKAGKYTTAYAVSDYISEHFCENISLEKLASAFFVSTSYLSRSFKEVSGVGISEYINILRIQKGQNLLGKTDMTISEISDELGFESMSYFGRVFKKHLGMSPAQYRKKLASHHEN